MSNAWVGALGTVAILGVAAAAVVASGVVDVAADTPHGPVVYRLLEAAREQSIARRLADITVPGELDTAERLRRGAGNYAAMCVECHLAPGKADSEIRMGLYPKPPDLTRPEEAAVGDMAARHFWIIKHGIKASGMPAWSKGGVEDESVWDLVAFIQKMPTLSVDQYVALVASSEGHSHGGLSHTEDQCVDGAHIPSAGNADSHEHPHSGGHEH